MKIELKVVLSNETFTKEFSSYEDLHDFVQDYRDLFREGEWDCSMEDGPCGEDGEPEEEWCHLCKRGLEEAAKEEAEEAAKNKVE